MSASVSVRWLGASMVLLCGWAARADDNLNTLTDQEKAAGWKLLFDDRRRLARLSGERSRR